MATRGSKRSAGASSTAPLKGALREEGETPESVAFQMLMERLESMERQRVLETQATQAALTATVESMKSLQAEMAREKRETTQAIEALHQKFREIIEARPDDPRVTKELIAKVKKDAQHEMAAQHAKFVEELKIMPTGEVYNHEGRPVRFIINGVDFIFQPGQNRKVPQAFVEQWESRQELRKWAAGVDRGFQSDERSISANEYELLRGRTPFWDEQRGKVG